MLCSLSKVSNFYFFKTDDRFETNWRKVSSDRRDVSAALPPPGSGRNSSEESEKEKTIYLANTAHASMGKE